jgi:hypothetical protein
MCWEKFKIEKCDAEQPESRLCKELLECSSRKEVEQDNLFDSIDVDMWDIVIGTTVAGLIAKWKTILQRVLIYLHQVSAME